MTRSSIDLDGYPDTVHHFDFAGGMLIFWRESGPPKWVLPKIKFARFTTRPVGLIIGWRYTSFLVGFVSRRAQKTNQR